MKSSATPKPQAPHKIKDTKIIIRGTDVEGRSTVNQYTLVKKLGEGTYGKVKLALKGEKEEKFAVKVIKKKALKKKREVVRDENGKIKYKDAFENVIREVNIMKKLNHPNLIKLHEIIDSNDSDKMYMVIDFAENGQIIEWDEDNSRFYHLRQNAHIEEDELRKMFRQIILGVEDLHRQGIIHRDIKPQNILEDKDGRIIVADLGVAAEVIDGNDIQTKTEGTYHFMCPESLNKNGNSTGYSGKAADVWALGISFFAFIYYKVPFNSENLMELFELIEKQPLEFPEDRPISSGLKDILNRMLEKNPRWRVKLDDLKNHEWLQIGQPAGIIREIEPISN